VREETNPIFMKRKVAKLWKDSEYDQIVALLKKINDRIQDIIKMQREFNSRMGTIGSKS